MSLYTITEEIRALNEVYLSMINEETGEFIGDISQLEIYEKELKEMLTNKSEFYYSLTFICQHFF